MKRHIPPSLLLFLLAIVVGQAQPLTGTLSGRVYAIAKGGDTKPARMADVFVASGDDQITLQQNIDRALAKRLEDIKNSSDAQEACLLASVSIHEAVKNGSNIQTVVTDEDGSFDLPKLKAGSYTVVVIGAANGSQSVWYLTTTVTAGKRQKVKLSEPVLACQ
ncbi:MAG TPA: carboxypeptidase-like regulatory domain-containing protein [Bryobacteraceae bacterium]